MSYKGGEQVPPFNYGTYSKNTGPFNPAAQPFNAGPTNPGSPPFNPNQPYPSGSSAGPSPGAPSAPPFLVSDKLPPGVTIDSLPMYDESKAPTFPSAPPFDLGPGYGSTGFNDIPLHPPPPYEDPFKNPPPKRDALPGAKPITENEAMVALVDLCKQHCCWGTKAATNMKILNMSGSTAFHYTLETFCEMRSTAWACSPYMTGQFLDTPNNGHAPMPWDIQLSPAAIFRNEKRLIEVPHTAGVKPCHRCSACGWLRCNSCFGRGRKQCMSCHGSGSRMSMNTQTHQQTRQTCMSCMGSGSTSCFNCHGRGRIVCDLCKGSANLKWFIQLTVNWINHLDDYILERTAMPDELIRKVQGHIAFQEEKYQVYPVTQCPEPSINEASMRIVRKHQTAFKDERVLQQRQKVRMVPVNEVRAKYNDKSFTFYVFGLENQAYSADYPQQMCCGCTVL